MADEINVQFEVQGPPTSVMQEFRANPPQALKDDGYEIVDESYNSLTFEKRYLDWPQKLMVVMTFGLALIFKSFMESVFRVTANFSETGSDTKILLNGTVHPRTKAKLDALIAELGGATGPRTLSMSEAMMPSSAQR